MSTKGKFFIFALALLAILLPLRSVSADTGPKPTMDFTFVQEVPGETLTIITGEMYECDLADCNDAKPLEKLGPQGFRCNEITCNALAYGFKNYHYITVEFSDGKTRQSNVFETSGFGGSYKVTIRADDLVVEPETFLGLPGPVQWILLCGCCCLLVALLITGLVLLFLRLRKK